MIKIRQGTFETNSSSMHSFSISNNGKNYGIADLVDKLIKEEILYKENNRYKLKVNICEGFGWGVDHFTDIKTKLSYFALRNIVEDDELRVLTNESYVDIANDIKDGFELYNGIELKSFDEFKDKLISCLESSEFNDNIGYYLEEFLNESIDIVLVDEGGNEFDEHTTLGYVEYQCGFESLYDDNFFGDKVKINQAVINFLCDDESVLVIDNDNH